MLVSIRRDSVKGWIVTCAACGHLASLRDFWPASRMARDHEAIHQDEG